VTAKKTILIVDDDVDFVRINRAILEQAGYNVVPAHSGAEGIEKAEEIKPDAVLLDFVMETGTQGASVAQRLAQMPGLAGVPVVLMTGVHRIKPWWKGLAPDPDWLPVSKVLEKPVSGEQLLATLAEILPA
jgi:CheY-like chemotaxis protein